MSGAHVEVGQCLVAVRVDGRDAFGDDAVDAVVRAISAQHMAGQAIDGSKVGIPGWVFVRLLADGEQSLLLRLDAEQEASFYDVPFAQLRTDLELVFGEVQVGLDLAVDGHEITEDGLFAVGPDWSALLVAPAGQHPLHLAAAVHKVSFSSTTVGGHALIARADRPDDHELAHDLSAHLLDLTSATGRKPVVVLWRRGAMTCVHLMRKGDLVDVHVWEPAWVDIRPTGMVHPHLDEVVDEVIDTLVPARSEGAPFAKAFGLDSAAAMNLRALLRRGEADIAGLVRLLGLPDEVATVFAGDHELTDLPGATVAEPTTMKTALRQEWDRTNEFMPSWFDKIENAGRDLAWWYVLASLAFGVVCAYFAVDWLRGGDTAPWLGVVALVAGLATLFDLGVRYVLRWRRSRQ